MNTKDDDDASSVSVSLDDQDEALILDPCVKGKPSGLEKYLLEAAALYAILSSEEPLHEIRG